MKLLHLSDLHIGKSIGNYSLIDDQRYALKEIVRIVEERKIDVVLIAGDIFDTSIPSSDALSLYSDFLDELIFRLDKKVLAIAGNHDSSKRLDINKNFYRSNNYFLVSELEREPIVLEDEYGKINFYLIPFISLAKAKAEIDSEIENFTDLYRHILNDISYEDRNVLVSHCYASNMGIYDEEIYDDGQKPLTIGGSDAMDANLFMEFDYVALGHLHRAHFVIDPKIRYSGTFMKYSFDEVLGEKSVTVIDLTKDIDIEKMPLKNLRDFEVRRGKFEDILKSEASDNYIKFILEDDYTIENAMAKLKAKFPLAVSISYANKSVFSREDTLDIDIENKDAVELFTDFYKFKMDEDMTNDEIETLKRIIVCDQKDL